jgi:hypothetical protein
MSRHPFARYLHLIFEGKKKGRLAATAPKFDQAFDEATAIAAALFHFLRQAGRRNANRPSE